jgi:DNA-binding NarL/FixJ family response regulator
MGLGRHSISTPEHHGELAQAESESLILNAQMDPIRLVLVDDHEIARRGIRSVLSEDPGIEVVGEIGSGEEAIVKVRELHPDVILLDISLPGISGIEAANSIRKILPESRIIFVSQHDSPLIAKDALLTGAYGYVVKSDAGLDLLPAIAAVHAGHTFVSRTLRALGWT